MIDPATRAFVHKRAEGRCEYCGLTESADPFFRFHVDHVTARQHGGSDAPDNLAFACYHCNARKGPNLTAIDPISGRILPLFHPRRDTWADNFVLNGNLIEENPR